MTENTDTQTGGKTEGKDGTHKGWEKDGNFKITFIDDNPHRNGTNLWQKFEDVKSCGTVGEAKEKGASAWQLNEWKEEGRILLIGGQGASSDLETTGSEEATKGAGAKDDNTSTNMNLATTAATLSITRPFTTATKRLTPSTPNKTINILQKPARTPDDVKQKEKSIRTENSGTMGSGSLSGSGVTAVTGQAGVAQASSTIWHVQEEETDNGGTQGTFHNQQQAQQEQQEIMDVDNSIRNTFSQLHHEPGMTPIRKELFTSKAPTPYDPFAPPREPPQHQNQPQQARQQQIDALEQEPLTVSSISKLLDLKLQPMNSKIDRLDKQVQQFQNDLKTSIEAVRTEFGGRIDAHRQQFEEQIQVLHNRCEKIDGELRDHSNIMSNATFDEQHVSQNSIKIQELERQLNQLKWNLANSASQNRYPTTMVVGNFSDRTTKSDAIAWVEDKISQICKFGTLDLYCKGDFKGKLWVQFDSKALRDAAVNKMNKADLKHVERKINFNNDEPVDIRAQHTTLRGIRKLLLSCGLQKPAIWSDEGNMTIHFNSDLIAKVGISGGKISIVYGAEWETFLNQGNLGEIIQKSNSMLERAGFTIG